MQRKGKKQDYDSSMVEYSNKIGDVVYKRIGFGKKLDTKYKGPYVIVKCLSRSVYEILWKREKVVIHYDRLKKYEADKLPSLVQKLMKNLKI